MQNRRQPLFLRKKSVPRPGDNIHIPLAEREALAALLAVKPTADMPRPGASRTRAKSAKAKLTAKAKQAM